MAASGFRSRRCARIISALRSLFSIIIFPSSICFDRRFDETDRWRFLKNATFAASHPGIGAVCTIGIFFTSASVEVRPPGFV